MSDSNSSQAANAPMQSRKHVMLFVLSLLCLSLVSMDYMHRSSMQLRFHYWDIARQMRKNKRNNRNNNARGKVAKNQVRKPQRATVKKGKISVKVKTPKPEENRKLVWLMTYPFSGSTVAINFIQGHTGYSMATNYGESMDTRRGFRTFVYDSIPVDESMPSGPFKYRQDLPLPPGGSDIVVKTHCGGFCIDKGVRGCLFNDYVRPLTRYYDFMLACASGTKFNSKKGRHKIKTKYNPNRAKKIIFLARDPLEIVRSRFLNEMEGPTQPGTKDYRPNKNGLKAWCQDYDAQEGSKTLVKRLYSQVRGLDRVADGTTCHAELYRIVQFYKQGLITANILKAKTFTVYFEDYDNDYGEVKDELMKFLEIREKENAKDEKFFEKKGNDSYKYFDPNQVRAAKKFMRILIGNDRKLKAMLQRYI